MSLADVPDTARPGAGASGSSASDQHAVCAATPGQAKTKVSEKTEDVLAPGKRRSRSSYTASTQAGLAPPLVAEVRQLALAHLLDHYTLYGEFLGVRSARKHIGWYVASLPGGEDFRQRMNRIEDCEQQLAAVTDYFDQLSQSMDRLPDAVPYDPAGRDKKEYMDTTE